MLPPATPNIKAHLELVQDEGSSQQATDMSASPNITMKEPEDNPQDIDISASPNLLRAENYCIFLSLYFLILPYNPYIFLPF